MRSTHRGAQKEQLLFWTRWYEHHSNRRHTRFSESSLHHMLHLTRQRVFALKSTSLALILEGILGNWRLENSQTERTNPSFDEKFHDWWAHPSWYPLSSCHVSNGLTRHRGSNTPLLIIIRLFISSSSVGFLTRKVRTSRCAPYNCSRVFAASKLSLRSISKARSSLGMTISITQFDQGLSTVISSVLALAY